MLNKKGERELCYIVTIDKIEPIEGADRVELVHIMGWKVMVRKGQFKEGDLAVYFEIDSKVPEKEPFMFLASKNFKVKTQKYFKGKVLSQGLLMSAEDFGWVCSNNMIIANEGKTYHVGDGLTERLGVTYSVQEDNERKKNPIDKYKRMTQLYPNVFKNKFIQKIYKRDWGKKLLFIFFGKKAKSSSFPAWVVKTDEERCQNLPYLFGSDNDIWIVTEKIDGTSTTFTMKRGRHFWNKLLFLVCSRNVCFNKPDRKCFYDTNVYIEMAEAYNMEGVLNDILNKDKTLSFVTIQSETYGTGIQKRIYNRKDHTMAVFNLIFGYKDGTTKRLNPIEMENFLNRYHIPCVPIVCEEYKLPNTVEKMLEYAEGASAIDGGMREGVVLRSLDGKRSFKAVSNNFLQKYHN